MSALNITALSLTRLLQMQLPWAWTLVLQPMLLHGLHWLTCRLGLLDVSSSVPPPDPRTAMALSLSHTLSLDVFRPFTVPTISLILVPGVGPGPVDTTPRPEGHPTPRRFSENNVSYVA